MRVVSLLPSATELCYAVGVEPVGVSHSCDYPPAARDVPAVTSTVVEHGPDVSTATIDEQVSSTAGSTYVVDDALLSSLDPDVVVTQATCDVCAVDETDVRTAIAAAGIDPHVVTLDPHSLSDVLDDLVRVGRAVGRAEAAREVAGDLRARIDRVRTRAEARAGAAGRPRALVTDWTDPVMVAGHWIPGMVETAGGSYGLREPGAASRPVEWAGVREYDPEVVIVSPCGFDLDRAVDAVEDLRDRPGWSGLRAVRDGRVYAVDGSGHVNRSGPRLVDSLGAIAACLHPDEFEADPTVVRRLDRAVA
jgi:iron complex transport system substrate-binding protein